MEVWLLKLTNDPFSCSPTTERWRRRRTGFLRRRCPLVAGGWTHPGEHWREAVSETDRAGWLWQRTSTSSAESSVHRRHPVKPAQRDKFSLAAREGRNHWTSSTNQTSSWTVSDQGQIPLTWWWRRWKGVSQWSGGAPGVYPYIYGVMRSYDHMISLQFLNTQIKKLQIPTCIKVFLGSKQRTRLKSQLNVSSDNHDFHTRYIYVAKTEQVHWKIRHCTEPWCHRTCSVS